MDIGMLWFDNDRTKDLFTKVSGAASYYQKKYGAYPNLCFVHPSMITPNGNGKSNGLPSTKKKLMAGDIEVRTAARILPNHFWIGIHGNTN